jgi:type IX secretion system PorP/SprF family membrane protein
MTKMRSILFLLMVQLSFTGVNAQDPVFSHFYANSMLLNPALAGVEGAGRVFIGYRNQWPNSGTSYITYQASYDQYVEKLHGGIGVRMLNDRQGDGTFNAYNLDVAYAYQFRASRRWSFAGALQAGAGQRSFDPSALVFGDMIDPVTGGSSGISTEDINSYNEIYPDFAAGIAAFRGNFYGGAAVHHLLRPVVTDSNDPTGTIYRKYTLHLGAMIPVIDKSKGNEIMKLSPNMVFMLQQNVHQINYGIDLIYRDFLVGLWTRHNIGFSYGNLVFTAGYGAGNLRFRYSYDVKLSSPTIRLPNMGAHEFSLVIMLENHAIRKNSRTINCPKI